MARLVRPGMEAVYIGIDPQSNYMNAVALLKPLSGPVARRYHLADTSGPTACRNGYRATQMFLDLLWEIHPNPTKTHWRVSIEKAISYGGGRGQSPILQTLTTGAICAALAERKARVSFVPPAQWKKIILGNGGLDKRRIASAVRQRWEDDYKALGGQQDLIDAYCIARFARHHGSS